MATVWTFLTVSIIATSCHVKADDHHMSMSEYCRSDMTQCSYDTITRGRCKSTWNSFMLNNLRNDVNNDCQASGIDFAADIAEDYDTDGDGALCGEEWITRRTTYGGLTSEFTSFEWYAGLSPDGSCVDSSMFANAPAIDLATTFTNMNIMRLVMFCNSTSNMMYNRDCWGLTYICKEARADFEACQMFDKGYMSLYEKMMAKHKDADTNMDGTLSPTELRNFMLTKYDSNGDRCVDQMEWRDVAINEYQFSQEFADEQYQAWLGGSSSCIDIDNMPIPAEGSSFDQMNSNTMERLVQMCEMKSNAYETNKDCAMVVDTCLKHFPNMEACSIYVDNCGMQRYSTCINKLTRSSCMSETDRSEVFMETMRIDNQLKYYCTPQESDPHYNSVEKTQVGYDSLLLSLFLVTVYNLYI